MRAFLVLCLMLGCLLGVKPRTADSACCYFAAKNKDILQPAQKVFITWDAKEKIETFTVQPKFEGNALDFGMVIPTPSQPKLAPMPRDFFQELAVYTILYKRKYPQSKLLPIPEKKKSSKRPSNRGRAPQSDKDGQRGVKVLESGVVGSLDYKIIKAGRADDLYEWLKSNRYNYSGDEATLDFYIKKKWIFTVMKIDTKQMKRSKDGSYLGEVTPTRFQFASKQLIYPLKITQLSVKEKTEALFYVQTSYKVDLPGNMTYQYQWVPMLQNAQGWYQKGIFGKNTLPGKGDDWLNAIKSKQRELLQRGQRLGFNFRSGQRPTPNKNGHIATTLEWAKKLTSEDVMILRGKMQYSETVPNPDEGFTREDLTESERRQEVYKVIQDRLRKYRKERPGGYLVREAPKEDINKLKILVGHLQAGQFLTKFRKTFAKDEMNEDLLILPAKIDQKQDHSEYTEVLPTSPP